MFTLSRLRCKCLLVIGYEEPTRLIYDIERSDMALWPRLGKDI